MRETIKPLMISFRNRSMICNRFSNRVFARYGRSGAFVLTALLLSAASAFAQYGKITVKITDEKTGEPMIHAVAMITQNHLGALTDDNGVAVIINVPPSQNYTVIAKYLGYIPDTAFHVQVQSDITTSLKFTLSTKVHEHTVYAQAPLVEKTKTNISTKYTNQEFASIPGRQRIDEIIQLTPGVVQDPASGGLSFHGSRGTSNSIRLNGVEITNPLTGTAGSLENGISRLAISEVDVVTGSADASKGGFTGGEVNTQTRAGGNQLSFEAHYRTEIPSLFGYGSNGIQQMPAGDNTYELALGGPLFTQDLKFYITGKLNSFDHYNVYTEPTGTFPNLSANAGLGVTDPLGNNLGEIPLTNRWRRTTTGQLAFDLFGFSLTANTDLNSETDMDNGWGHSMRIPTMCRRRNRRITSIRSLRAAKLAAEFSRRAARTRCSTYKQENTIIRSRWMQPICRNSCRSRITTLTIHRMAAFRPVQTESSTFIRLSRSRFPILRTHRKFIARRSRV